MIELPAAAVKGAEDTAALALPVVEPDMGTAAAAPTAPPPVPQSRPLAGDAGPDQLRPSVDAEQTSLADDYVKHVEKTQANDALSKLRDRFVKPAKPVTGAEAPAPMDSARESLSETATGMAGAAARDVGKGAIEIASGRAIWAGMNRAVNEAADTIASAFGVDLNEVADSIEGATGLPTRFQFKEPESVTGQAATSVVQFLTGFIPALKAMRAAQLPALLGTGLGTAVEGAAAGAIGDVLSFDEHAQRLSNVIQSVPALQNPVTEWLAADDDDSALEGKIKQAVEGVGLGMATEAFMGSLRAFKRWRDARELMPDEVAAQATRRAEREAAVTQAVDESVDLAPRDVMLLGGDPEKPLFEVTEKTAKVADDMVQAAKEAVASEDFVTAIRSPGRDPKPISLLSFLKANGGIKEDAGELAARGLNKARPGLVSGSGSDLDEAARAAWEAGYFGRDVVERPTANDLLALIDDELRGTKRFSFHDDAAVAKAAQMADYRATLDAAGVDWRKASGKEIDDALRAAGKEPAAPVEAPSLGAARMAEEADAEGLLQGSKPRTLEDLTAETAAAGEQGFDVPGVVKVGNKVGNVNLARIQEPQDVLRVIEQGAKAVPIEETVTQSTQVARDNIEKWLGPEQAKTILSGQSALGRAFTREEVIFTGDLLAQTGESIRNLAGKIAKGQGSDVEKVALKRAVAFQETVLRTVSQQAREAGRALQAFQTGVAGNRLSAQAMRDLLAEGTSAERMAAVIERLDSPEQLSAFIKGGWWRNVSDALFESWMGSKLISPWTHMRNVAGNSLAMMGQVAERGVAARIGGGEGVVKGEAAAMARGVVSGFTDALRGAGASFRTGLPAALDKGVKAEVGQAARRKAISAAKLGLDENSWLGKALDFYGEWVNGMAFRGLVAEDEFFKGIARRMQLHALAYRQATHEGLKGEALAGRYAELVAAPPPALQDATISFARHVTFQDQLGQAGNAVNMLRNRTPFGRYVLPFLQTPANIFKYSMARTPLALATPTFWADAAAGGARRDLAMAKLGLGSMLMATFADWTGQGMVTGQGPSDPGQRQLWDRQGKLPYAVKLGDRWVQYNQLEPLGLGIGIAADVAQILDVADDVKGLASDPKALDRAYARLIDAGFSPEEASKLTQRAEEQMSAGFTALPGTIVQSMAYNLLEKSYLSGVSNLAEVIFAPSAEARTAQASRFVQDFASGFVPLDAGLRWAERIADPEIREAKGMIEALKAMTPGLSSDLPGIPDLWGRPRVSSVAFSPFGTKSAESSPVDDEMARLGFDMSMPDKTLKGVRLAPAEYAEFVGLAGNELKHPSTGMGARDTIEAILDGSYPDKTIVRSYRQASDGPDGRKATLIRKVMLDFRDAARNEMLRRHPDLRILAEEIKRSAAERKAN